MLQATNLRGWVQAIRHKISLESNSLRIGPLELMNGGTFSSPVYLPIQ